MSTFETVPRSLKSLLKDSHRGDLQLPEFQRSWIWDEDRIKSLIASVSRSFPIGALMCLQTGGEVQFEERPIEGTTGNAGGKKPTHLILDGQQRITSLYQSCFSKEVVRTVTARHKKVSRWFYLDIKKAIDTPTNREDAIVGVPEDRIVRTNFGRDVVLDLSTQKKELQNYMFPLNRVFDYSDWDFAFLEHWELSKDEFKIFKEFKKTVLRNFADYQVPVIRLGASSSISAVCLVFEKVNTGGKPLDTFELLTAMYAAQKYSLRDDWIGTARQSGRKKRLQEFNILQQVASTDFLQVVSLLHTKTLWNAAKKAGRTGRDLPPVSAARQALLQLPLQAYKDHADSAERGLATAAKFLHGLNIFRVTDLPYKNQLIPLAAILAELGQRWENSGVRDSLAEWYWNGVFGELYGSATDTRYALDIVQVPHWAVSGGAVPATVADAIFRTDRLDSLRTRGSAAYKGLNALLMVEGAKDFRSSQTFGHTVFFGESVDIHHIFPQHWCKARGIEPARFNSIVNKTPLSWRTNRILGGDAPSRYLQRLERGGTDQPPIPGPAMDGRLLTHLIDPVSLRGDDFERFYDRRKAALLGIVETAMKKSAYRGEGTDEPEEDVPDDED